MKKNCAHCGSEFNAQRSNAKYCRQSCRTMASNIKNGYKIGRIRVEEKSKELAVESSTQVIPQVMNGIESGRAADVITGGGTLESFFEAGLANMVTQFITHGEYDERIANLQRALNYIIHLLEKIAGVQRSQEKPKYNVMAIPKMNQQTQSRSTTTFPDKTMM